MNDRLQILVLSTFDGTDASVTRDFLFSFNAYSRHAYRYVFDCRTLDETTDFSAFDAILVFWTVDLVGPDLSEVARARIAASRAVKVLFRQDEHRDVRATNEAMRQLGIELLFTCVAESDHRRFYPGELVPSLRAVHTVLPGYVPGYLERLAVGRDTKRPLDLSYRSRVMPFYLGDLGQEKRIAAERFRVIAADHGLRADISVREEDRLYGRRWLDLLRASRCVLGTASGASVIDFTGEIRRNCERYLALHPDAPYEDVKTRFFADVDGQVVIDTVSPRVFEAAATRSTMVHHEGGYAGILEPDRHYIMVRRDYSNVGEVVDRIKDHAWCRRVAREAHQDLVRSGRYSYRAFAGAFDRDLARGLGRRTVARGVSALRFYTSRYLHHGQTIVPRGRTFFVVPSADLFFEVVRRALARVPRARFGPAVSRLVQNPKNFVVKTIVIGAVVLATPPLRTLFRHFAIARARGGRVALFDVLDDLRKLWIVHRIGTGRLIARQPFELAMRFDAGSGTLTLSSFTSATGDSRRSDWPDIAAALVTGKLGRLVWDHSALGHQIVYVVGRRGGPRRTRRRWITAGLGPGGVHRFDAVTELYRREPSAAASALVALLRACADAVPSVGLEIPAPAGPTAR